VRLAKLAASGLGTGWVPVSPGTAGSLLALLLGAPMLAGPPWLLPAAAAAAALVGLWAIGACHVHGDPRWVVIDEIAGQWLAMAGLARVSALGLAAAFLIFRLLDIAKPGPVGWADRQPGAAGIMADDLIAGGLTAGIVWAVRSRWPELLS